MRVEGGELLWVALRTSFRPPATHLQAKMVCCHLPRHTHSTPYSLPPPHCRAGVPQVRGWVCECHGPCIAQVASKASRARARHDQAAGLKGKQLPTAGNRRTVLRLCQAAPGGHPGQGAAVVARGGRGGRGAALTRGAAVHRCPVGRGSGSCREGLGAGRTKGAGRQAASRHLLGEATAGCEGRAGPGRAR